MTVDIVIPELGESITEATILRWTKGAGEAVERDEIVVEIETDKATMELVAPETGVLSEILKGEGDKVLIGDVIARVTPGAQAPRTAGQPVSEQPVAEQPVRVVPPPVASVRGDSVPSAPAEAAAPLSPAVRRLVEEHALRPPAIPATGRGGRLTKGDVLQHLESQADGAQTSARLPPVSSVPNRPAPSPSQPVSLVRPASAVPRERIEPMSRIRRRIAERLKQVQNTAAILTTFNEIDMSATIALRAKYNETFKERYGIALGFMSIFAKASVEALRAFPAINAEIRGDDIVYKNYYDLGIAVGTEQGLLVPVIRDVDAKSFSAIELELADLGQRARSGKIKVEELTGGTFTISNGGVYGSLMSTPILNPPQSGILGMHKTEKRPIVVGPHDEIVVRPMMYVALSYDHRIVDGREAVLFLRRIKDCIEDPARMLFGL